MLSPSRWCQNWDQFSDTLLVSENCLVLCGRPSTSTPPTLELVSELIYLLLSTWSSSFESVIPPPLKFSKTITPPHPQHTQAPTILSSLSLPKKLSWELFRDSVIYLSLLSIFFLFYHGCRLGTETETVFIRCVLLGSILVARREGGGIWLESEGELLCSLTALVLATGLGGGVWKLWI